MSSEPSEVVEKAVVVSLNGVQTAVHAWGVAESPPVIVLHSAGLDGTSLTAFAAALVRRGRSVLAPDLRGHGASTADPDDVRLDLMADDVVALAEEVSAGPLPLVGTSMGGVVAGLAAGLSPASWSALTVYCSPDRGYPVFAERATAVSEGGMDGQVEPTLRRWFTNEQWAQDHPAIAQCRASLAAMDPGCWDAVWRDFATFGGWPDLHGRPGLFAVAGSQDVSTPPAVMERIASGAGTELDVLDGGSHQLLMTHAEEAAGLCRL